LKCTFFARRGFLEGASYTSKLFATSVNIKKPLVNIAFHDIVLMMEMFALCTIVVHPLNFFVPFLVALSAKRYEVAIVILPRLAPCDVSDMMHVSVVSRSAVTALEIVALHDFQPPTLPTSVFQ
jgi:hypothetical protein